MRWTEHFYAFDTESTGTDPTTARPVSVALVEFRERQIVDSRLWIVDTGVECPPEAEAVHCITAERIAAEGLPPGAVLEALLGVATEDLPWVAHNVRYDATLLATEAERWGLTWPDLHYIDTLVIDRHLDKYRSGGRKLGTVCEHHGVSLTDAHDATADATAAGLLAIALGDLYPTVGRMSPARLHDAQVGWFESWRAQFNEYLSRKSDNPDFVTGTWPR